MVSSRERIVRDGDARRITKLNRCACDGASVEMTVADVDLFRLADGDASTDGVRTPARDVHEPPVGHAIELNVVDALADGEVADAHVSNGCGSSRANACPVSIAIDCVAVSLKDDVARMDLDIRLRWLTE